MVVVVLAVQFLIPSIGTPLLFQHGVGLKLIIGTSIITHWTFFGLLAFSARSSQRTLSKTHRFWGWTVFAWIIALSSTISFLVGIFTQASRLYLVLFSITLLEAVGGIFRSYLVRKKRKTIRSSEWGPSSAPPPLQVSRHSYARLCGSTNSWFCGRAQ